jgi:hypothetical protein
MHGEYAADTLWFGADRALIDEVTRLVRAEGLIHEFVAKEAWSYRISGEPIGAIWYSENGWGRGDPELYGGSAPEPGWTCDILEIDTCAGFVGAACQGPLGTPYDKPDPTESSPLDVFGRLRGSTPDGRMLIESSMWPN